MGQITVATQVALLGSEAAICSFPFDWMCSSYLGIYEYEIGQFLRVLVYWASKSPIISFTIHTYVIYIFLIFYYLQI